MWGRGTLWSPPLQKEPQCWHPEQKNWPVYLPPVSQPLWSQRRLHDQRNLPLCQDEYHHHPCLYLLVSRWVWLTPSRLGGLALEHTPGSPAGFCLLGVPVGNCITLPSNRQSVMWVPVLDHFPDIPDPDIPAQTPRPTWLLSTDWGALSKCNALYLTHEWLHCSKTPRWTLDQGSTHS